MSAPRIRPASSAVRRSTPRPTARASRPSTPSSRRPCARGGTHPSHTDPGASRRLDACAWMATAGLRSPSESKAFAHEMTNARSRSCGAKRPEVRRRKHMLACPRSHRSRRTAGTQYVQVRCFPLDSQRVQAGLVCSMMSRAGFHSGASPRSPAVLAVLWVLHGTPPMRPSTCGKAPGSMAQMSAIMRADGKCAPKIARLSVSTSTAHRQSKDGIVRWSPQSRRPAPENSAPYLTTQYPSALRSAEARRPRTRLAATR